MSNIQEIEQQYREELKKIDKRCKELEAENIEDAAKLQKLEQDYKLAVGELDEKKADSIYDQMHELRKGIGNRNGKLSILKNKDPEQNLALKNLAAKLIKGYAAEKDSIRDTAIEKVKAALKIREQYLKAVSELIPLNSDYYHVQERIKRYVKQVDNEVLAELNIHPRADIMPSHDVANIPDFEIIAQNFIDYRKNEKEVAR
jgi:hypothetical protein